MSNYRYKSFLINQKSILLLKYIFIGVERIIFYPLSFVMVKNIVNQISKNFKSGLSVAIVSIPLSIPLAVASGATPLQGILTAIYAGLIASLFG